MPSTKRLNFIFLFDISCCQQIPWASTMAREDFVCAHRLRVRWVEVDMQKVVFNGHYLTYIDIAIAEYWREIGLPYPHGDVESYANDIFFGKTTLEYLGSAR